MCRYSDTRELPRNCQVKKANNSSLGGQGSGQEEMSNLDRSYEYTNVSLKSRSLGRYPEIPVDTTGHDGVALYCDNPEPFVMRLYTV